MGVEFTDITKVLLLKVAEGDEKAFSELFRIYYNQLGDFIMRITESETITQEIVQDVFLKIWVNRKNLGEIECFKAYLLVVARNHAYNYLKKMAREKSKSKEWARTIVHHTYIDIEDRDIKNPEDLIDEAINLLPPQQMKVYTLSRRNGMKQSEIARELNISLETVKKHMVLALRFLKNYLHTNKTYFFLLAIIFSENLKKV